MKFFQVQCDSEIKFFQKGNNNNNNNKEII